MTWNSIMGFISSIALFLPIFFILVLPAGLHTEVFLHCCIYYTIVFIYNLMTEGYIQPNPELYLLLGDLFNNLLDAPLMLILSYLFQHFGCIYQTD